MGYFPAIWNPIYVQNISAGGGHLAVGARHLLRAPTYLLHHLKWTPIPRQSNYKSAE